MARNNGAMAEAPRAGTEGVDPPRPDEHDGSHQADAHQAAARQDGSHPADHLVGGPADAPRTGTPRVGTAHRAASPEPATERGRRTRAVLIDAARRVFAERGYIDATIADITAAAEVAHGTFYTYFESKRDLFHEVVEALMADFRAEARSLPKSGDDPWARVERANRGYLRAYARNARLLGVIEQMAMADPDLREIRLASRRFWVERSEGRIRQWQAAGLARPEVDAHYAANALGAMVDRCAFLWLVLGEDYDEDRAVASLTDLYTNALGLPVPAPA